MIRIYLNDWFVNAGILGFYQVLNKKMDPTLWTTQANSIEFDPKVLETFAEHFIEELLNKYDRYPSEEKRLQGYLRTAIQEDFPKGKKGIQNAIKQVKGKIEKVNRMDVSPFVELLEQVKSLDNNKKEKLPEIVNAYLSLIKEAEVHYILTMSSVRSLLSKELFGQPSFTNIGFKDWHIKEKCIQKFHKDYVQPVIEEIQFLEWIKQFSGDQRLAEAKKKKKEKGLPETFKKYVNALIKQKDLVFCSIQSDFPSDIDFEEKIFAPLGLSLNENPNIGWDGQHTLPISYMTRLLFFCIAIGAHRYDKRVYDYYQQDQGSWQNGFSFINTEASIVKLYRLNQNFSFRKTQSNPFHELVFDYITETKHKSRWMLQNIVLVEFSMEGKNCRLDHLQIPRKIAEFFVSKASINLTRIEDRSFRNRLIGAILAQKEWLHLVRNELRSCITKGMEANDCQKAIDSHYKYKQWMQRGENVNESMITQSFQKGVSLAKRLHDKEQQNKIPAISYQLLNACRSGNKELFFQTLLRVYMSLDLEMDQIFLNIFHENEVPFDELGYSFIAGLQKKFKKNKEDQNNGKGTNS